MYLGCSYSSWKSWWMWVMWVNKYSMCFLNVSYKFSFPWKGIRLVSVVSSFQNHAVLIFVKNIFKLNTLIKILISKCPKKTKIFIQQLNYLQIKFIILSCQVFLLLVNKMKIKLCKDIWRSSYGFDRIIHVSNESFISSFDIKTIEI